MKGGGYQCNTKCPCAVGMRARWIVQQILEVECEEHCIGINVDAHEPANLVELLDRMLDCEGYKRLLGEIEARRHVGWP